MKNIKIKIKQIAYTAAILVFTMTMATSCLDDLNTVERGPNVELDPYANANNYPMLVAKIYSGFNKVGLTGADGEGDIPSSGDQGKTNFLRIYFNMQELTSDEAKFRGSDNDERFYSQSVMAPDNNIGYMMYLRGMMNIAYANDFMRNTETPRVEVADLDRMRTEVRVLRAMNYYFLLDLFGDPGWITEEHPVDGSYAPTQLGSEGLFNWLESELKAILTEGKLKNHSPASYGLVTNQVVQTVLAKLYLNAEVYTKTARWADALTYAKMVTSYTALELEGNFRNNFCADNHKSKEIIFALPYDYDKNQDWGGMTSIMAMSTDGDMTGDLLNFTASWSMIRTTQQLTSLFDGADKRALFAKDDREQEINDIDNFKSGWGAMKFTNRGWDDVANPNGNNQWVDTDFPLFRLADLVLIQAEAELRLKDGNALSTFNKVHAHTRTGLTAKASISLQDILDERGRELYWEAQRRTDLIRFGKFSKGYNWAWKAGVKEGKDIDAKYELFPIATRHLTGNPALQQTALYR